MYVLRFVCKYAIYLYRDCIMRNDCVIIRSCIMKKYETPELKSIYFSIENKTMDGYNEGDINDNPWDELFTDRASGEA